MVLLGSLHQAIESALPLRQAVDFSSVVGITEKDVLILSKWLVSRMCNWGCWHDVLLTSGRSTAE